MLRPILPQVAQAHYESPEQHYPTHLINYSYSKKIIRRCMEKYSLLTKLAKCTLNIALKLIFSVFLFFFVFWLHFRPPRHCLRPFLERQFFTQMTVERREEKVGKPLLTGSALGGDKFRDICICDMETIPPETQGHPMDLFLKISVLQAHFCWLGDLKEIIVLGRKLLLGKR